MDADPPCAVEGCTGHGTKLCSRCGQKAYCSPECQRKDWKVHKLTCKKAETPENRIGDLLRQGRLFSAQCELEQLQFGTVVLPWCRNALRFTKPNPRLAAELEEKMKFGTLSEVVDDVLQLQPIEGFGLGYVAAKELLPGQPLLFDTAFSSAPMDGDKEFYCTIAEKAIRKGHGDRRVSARADAQADFYYDSILKLGTKDSHDRATLEETDMDPEMREQILVCSIAEANSMYCTEDPSLLALFAAGARFHHSCAPNATLESSKSTLLVRAGCAIPMGSEVTISYLPHQLLLEAGAKRRERLLNGRGFHCRCQRCESEQDQ